MFKGGIILKPDLCYGCKKRPPLKKPETAQVNGFSILIKPFGLLCIDCLKEELSNKFEQLENQEQRFVKEKNGTIEIDWKIINGLAEESQGFAYDVLLAMDILSLLTEGNWQILAYGGMMLNPRRFHSVLYFKKEQDVIDFATATLNNTWYTWEIQHIPKVIKRSDIMGHK